MCDLCTIEAVPLTAFLVFFVKELPREIGIDVGLPNSFNLFMQQVLLPLHLCVVFIVHFVILEIPKHCTVVIVPGPHRNSQSETECRKTPIKRERE